MAHTMDKNNHDDHREDETNPDSEWEIIQIDASQTNEASMFLEKKYYIIQTGNTMNAHEAIIKRFKDHQPDLQEVFHVDECDFILLFCPVVSRVGTDIEAAMQVLQKYPDTKPAVLMVLHHTFDPECVLPDSSSAVNRINTIIIHWRFHEDQGLLQCPKNDESFGVLINHMPTLVPVQSWWFGMESFPNILSSLFQYVWKYTNFLSQAYPIQDKEETPEPELRLVLMGRTGKTAAGNCILGIEEKIQATTSTATSLFTQQSESRQGEVDGRKLTIVVTPDWFSSEFSLENLRQDVGHCVRLSAPGPHAFLLVVPVMQPTREETGMLEKIEEFFGEECWKNIMILFTVNDKSYKKEVEKLIQSDDQEVKKLLEKCGNRFYLINIQEKEDNAQVPGLLEKIDHMVQKSKMKYYSSEVYQEVESMIKKMFENANEKHAKAEREMEEKQMEENALKFLLPELWKGILSLQYKSAQKTNK